MSVKCLCKIAILKTNQEADADSNSVTITHNGKLYSPIVDWDHNYIEDVSKHRDFCVVALKCDDAEYLTIFHDGTRHVGARRVPRENILSICFPDFRPTPGIHIEDEISKANQSTIHNVTAKLYNLLRTAHLAEDSKLFIKRVIKIDRLQPELRNYQRNTLQWLLYRELKPATMNNFYEKLISREGCECYVHLLTLDIKDVASKDIDIPFGGILADEMGLGKTVEILSLILLNQRVLKSINEDVEPPSKKLRMGKSQEIKLFCVCSCTTLNGIEQCSYCYLYQHQKCIRSYIDFPLSEEEGYICPRCWELKGIQVVAAATIIVSPNSIKLQWLSEINKHTSPPLRVLLYEGVAKQKISPKELASYDIVLTDYAILRAELYYQAANEMSMSLRTERRKMRVNSPLVLVDWWRVCLDEAQMESLNSGASKTVKLLPATYRWAVTGTPIQSSLDDLVSLLDFIGLEEVISKRAWKYLSGEFNRGRSENLIKILQKVMWRTSKTDVLNELGIPLQSQLTHFIELNNVEKLFYSDEHADCLNAFHAKIKGYTDLKGVTPRDLNLILQPMLKIRQDCSIPVLLTKTETRIKKKFLQPKELLDHMRTANEIECKNELRSMASIYNGIAALCFLKADYNQAIIYYERVMDLSKKHSGAICIDSLLQIHALYNAIQAYRILNSEDTPIIKEYEDQCNQLEWKFLEDYSINLTAALNGYTSASNALNEQKPSKSCEVWERIFEEFKDKSQSQQLVCKINDEVALIHSSSVYERFRTINAVLLVLDMWYNRLIKVRKDLFLKFESLDFFVQNVRPQHDVPVAKWRLMNAFIRSVYECHLQKNETTMKTDEGKKSKKKDLCQLCHTEKLLKTYECLIFDKTLDEKTSNAEGTWNPTMQETILKSIYSAVRMNSNFRRRFANDCDSQFEVVAAMKTEYKALVKLWVEIEFTVKAYDEMDMCKMRISLAKPYEEKTHFEVYEYEIDDVLAESKQNFNDAQKQFVLKYSRLKYIHHLEKNADPGPCPICRAEEHVKYVVLECGHHLCLFCFDKMSQIKRTSNITCSICRNLQKYEKSTSDLNSKNAFRQVIAVGSFVELRSLLPLIELYCVTACVHYVTRNINKKEGFEIRGDYSSKIQNIVLEVIKLKFVDKNVKILIFSQWMPILKAISEALEENNILFKINKSPKSVEEFKNEMLGVTCLLMMLGKQQGLNVIEATHVFLVEPVLNIGEELQAIGRIHRIGQTKPTFVHRFIVKNTIEENIYNTVNKDKTNKSDDLTIESIKKLFEVHSNSS